MRRKRDQRGAAAVEFALVVPILAMLLIGTFTVAIAYSQKVALNNAVREGARLGATAPNTASWVGSVQQFTSDTYGDSPALDKTTVCAALIKTTGGVSPSETVLRGPGSGCDLADGPDSPSNIAAGCFVKVWASKQTHLNWLLGSADPFTKATAVAVYDRNETCT